MYLVSASDIRSTSDHSCHVVQVPRRNRFSISLKSTHRHNDRYLQSVETSMITNLFNSKDILIPSGYELSYMGTCAQRSLELDTGNSNILSRHIYIRRLNGTRSFKPT